VGCELSRIAEQFERIRAKGEKALVAFVTAGDPFPTRTADVIVTLAEAGADIIELGIPFSDPLADGPTIQDASQRALIAGMTPPKVFDIVREARQRTQTPIVLMGSWNPALQYGMARFAQDAAEAGADGTIMTDLTPEEAGVWKSVSDSVNLDTIFLLAPTSTPSRMALVGRMASGFIYCVSRTGITGAQNDVPSDLPPLIEAIRPWANETPICVGFGIHTPAHVTTITRYTDGAVVGSSLVSLLYKERENPNALGIVRDYITSLKAATL